LVFHTTEHGDISDATGPSNATSAILIIYDIFGYKPQTLQGADILAHSDSEHQYRVFMPDFLQDNHFPMENFPPNTEAKKKALGDLFGGPAAPPANAEKVHKLIDTIGKTEEGKGVKKWGSLGMCWGAKVRNRVLSVSVGGPLSPGKKSIGALLTWPLSGRLSHRPTGYDFFRGG